MLPKIRMHYHTWAMIVTTLQVVGLTAILLATAQSTFNAINEKNATARFSQIADRTVSELVSLIETKGRNVTAFADTDLAQFVNAGRINPQAMTSTFISSLAADPTLYSQFFALGNEEFLQVIGIRADPRIVAALGAPAAAWFAVRRITQTGNGTRNENYQFLDQQRRLLSSRDQAAEFVPTNRPWYGAAMQHGGLIVTDPYLFASTGELGITVAAPLQMQAGVLATDITLRSLQSFLGRLPLTDNGAVAIQDGQGKVLAWFGRGVNFGTLTVTPMTPVESLQSPYLEPLHEVTQKDATVVQALGAASGERYAITRLQVTPAGGMPLRITVMAPLSDFSSVFTHTFSNITLVALLTLVILLPLAYFSSRMITNTLNRMTELSGRLTMLDFSQPPKVQNTFFHELAAVSKAQILTHEMIQARTMDLKKSQVKLARLVESGISLSREQDRNVLLLNVLNSAREIAHCAAATMFLKTENSTLTFALRTSEDHLPTKEIPLFDEDGRPNDRFVVVHAALLNETVIIDDVYTETRFDLSGTKRFSEDSGLHTVSILTVPLSPREGEVVGVIQLLNALDPESGAVIPFPKELIGFVEALAAQSAIALENQDLIEAQRLMVDSLIQLIAGSIDIKSPYTGGHCERVPELAIMLAEAASNTRDGPLADFSFKTDDEWREFRIGAWLHDCGKVTTPEYVVDKATKLETIHNRIHEIRTRFEILLRDARIHQLEAIANGADSVEAMAQFKARQVQLGDDFSFIAECNLGGEFMAPEKIDRLRKIAATTWLRHFDDRLGLAHGELKRYADTPVQLPVTEHLLEDKPHHIIQRPPTHVSDPKWGFKVEMPEHLYNQGELHNLSISRGTLTEEERFKINEHVMQSLIMLEQLPLPKNLKRVPEYAGTHHETLIGTGYPRKLNAKELSIPMRIMAVADIFEALTASDRPYKKAKTLSESIDILSFFKKDKHIDPDIFNLLLTSGVFKRYAEKFLLAEQIDEVEISKYVN